jgi:hypothetical protein
MTHVLRVALVVACLWAAAGCAGPAVTADDPRVAAVGLITDIDPNHGYMIVEFPTHRMFVSMDKRDIGKFIVGDTIRVDSFGRPLAPVPRG